MGRAPHGSSDRTVSDDLQAAIQAGDLTRVVDIYLDGVAVKDAAGNKDSAGFLLTQAWIFALEAGDPRATEIRARLIAEGRENEA